MAVVTDADSDLERLRVEVRALDSVRLCVALSRTDTESDGVGPVVTETLQLPDTAYEQESELDCVALQDGGVWDLVAVAVAVTVGGCESAGLPDSDVVAEAGEGEREV